MNGNKYISYWFADTASLDTWIFPKAEALKIIRRLFKLPKPEEKQFLCALLADMILDQGDEELSCKLRRRGIVGVFLNSTTNQYEVKFTILDASKDIDGCLPQVLLAWNVPE